MQGKISYSESDKVIISLWLLQSLFLSQFYTEGMEVSPNLGKTSTTIIQSSSIVECDKNARRTADTNVCVCNNGYTGNGLTCSDLNECSSRSTNDCSVNGACLNTVGSYTCKCKSGFAGNGVFCQDNDECKTPFICDRNAECTNTVGSFSCKCKTGYSGDGFSCADIDECESSNPCSHDCVNSPGSFSCTCPIGFRLSGLFTCEDKNECADGSSDCSVNADCNNTVGSFTCTCKKSGFFGYIGDGKTCIEDRFLPFKNAAYLENTDEGFAKVIATDRIVIGNEKERLFYVCANGQISFRIKRSYYYGKRARLPFNVLAGFWSDMYLGKTTFTNGNRLYYGYYNKGDNQLDTSSILAKGNKIIADYLLRRGEDAFTATAALLGTWNKVTPFTGRRSSNSDQVASFQTVLLTDGTKTYLMFIYEENGMKWRDSWRDVFVGYSISRANQHEESISVAKDQLPFAYDTVLGNSGRKGLWIYKIGDKVTNVGEDECLDWIRTQPSISLIQFIERNTEVDCPPSQIQAALDRRFKPIFKEKAKLCYHSRRAQIYARRLVFVKCCYDFFGSLFTGITSSNLPLTTWYLTDVIGFFDLFFRLRRKMEEEKKSTALAFTNCCINSDLCARYRRRRLVPDGSRYTLPFSALLFGDPHIRTLDGKDYTYNGLGDFVMITTLNTTSNFTCHARTEKAPLNVTSGQTRSLATVFSGFAFYEINQPKVEIYLNLTDNQVSIIANETRRQPSEFTTEQIIEDVTIQSRAGTETKIDISFPSGMSSTVSVMKGGLTIEFTIDAEFQNKTRGLLGNVNGNIDDDFTLPNGTLVDVNSTEEEIFYKFGNHWQLTAEDSLFSVLGSGESFTPVFFNSVDDLFGNDVELKTKSIETCGGTTNRECLFDAYATRDLSVATQTAESKNKFVNDQNTLAKFPPRITGPTLLHLSFGEVFNSTIMVSSNSTNLKYGISVNGSIATVNETTGAFSINVTNYSNISVQFNVIDRDSDLSRILTPNLKMCYCLNGDVCDFSKDNEGYISGEQNAFLTNVACNCSILYEGPFCEIFIDPCESSPCFGNVSCTSSKQFGNRSCGACPVNYIGDGEKCSDLDECVASNPCQQVCTNFLGGFNCSCFSGYQETNSTHCADIDECSQFPSVCHANATCVNIPGSYNCTCREGFVGNGVNCTDIDECSSSPCSQNCTNTLGSFECSCVDDTRFRINGTRCEDVDECLLNSTCGTNALCFNQPGTFFCICKEGFSGDGKTCIATESSSTIVVTSSSKLSEVALPSAVTRSITATQLPSSLLFATFTMSSISAFLSRSTYEVSEKPSPLSRSFLIPAFPSPTSEMVVASLPLTSSMNTDILTSTSTISFHSSSATNSLALYLPSSESSNIMGLPLSTTTTILPLPSSLKSLDLPPSTGNLIPELLLSTTSLISDVPTTATSIKVQSSPASIGNIISLTPPSSSLVLDLSSSTSDILLNTSTPISDVPSTTSIGILDLTKSTSSLIQSLPASTYSVLISSPVLSSLVIDFSSSASNTRLNIPPSTSNMVSDVQPSTTTVNSFDLPSSSTSDLIQSSTPSSRLILSLLPLTTSTILPSSLLTSSILLDTSLTASSINFNLPQITTTKDMDLRTSTKNLILDTSLPTSSTVFPSSPLTNSILLNIPPSNSIAMLIALTSTSRTTPNAISAATSLKFINLQTSSSSSIPPSLLLISSLVLPTSSSTGDTIIALLPSTRRKLFLSSLLSSVNRDIRPSTNSLVLITSPLTNSLILATSPSTRVLVLATSPSTRDLVLATSQSTRDLVLATSPLTGAVILDTFPSTSNLVLATSPSTRDLILDTSPSTSVQILATSLSTRALILDTSLSTSNLVLATSFSTRAAMLDTSPSTGDLILNTSPSTRDLILDTSLSTSNLILATSPSTRDLILATSPSTRAVILDTSPSTRAVILDASTSTRDLILDTSLSTSNLILATSPSTRAVILDTSPSIRAVILDASTSTRDLILDTSLSTSNLILATSPSTRDLTLDTSLSTRDLILDTSLSTNNLILATSFSTIGVVLDTSSSTRGLILDTSPSTSKKVLGLITTTTTTRGKISELPKISINLASPSSTSSPIYASPSLTSSKISPSPSLSSSKSLVSTSVVQGVCINNPCKNGAKCTTLNKIPVCQCSLVFHGQFCNESRKLMEVSTTFLTMSIDGTALDLTDPGLNDDLQKPTSARYKLIKNVLEDYLFTTSKKVASETEKVTITNLRIGSLVATYVVALSKSYQQSSANFAKKLKDEISSNNNRAISSRLDGIVASNSVKGNDFNECSVNPCHASANCGNTELEYECSCISGFKGDGFSCTKEESDTSSTTIAVSAVAGGLFLLVVILIVVYGFKKRARNRGLRDDFNYGINEDFNWGFVNSRLRASRQEGGLDY